MADNSFVTEIDQIKILAKQHQDDFEVLGHMLELNDDVSDEQIDIWVESVAKPIVDAIDCTQCGNCCRSLDVYLTQDDAQRLADGIDVALNDILDTDIDRASAQKYDEWGRFSAKPCSFLDGKLCSVYAFRPDSCRAYPVFTPDFRWIVDDISDGASLCPIIYNVLLTLYQRIDELYER